MYNVANGEDELSVVLDSLNSPIASIANPATWLSVEQTGTQDGHPVIRIKAQESQPNVQKEAQLILMAEDGNMVELTVCQGFNFVPDSNSNDKFLTDWENQDTVVIFSQYGFERIFTPWSDTYSSVTIPEDICRNVKKKDGWEMAFCALGNDAGRDLNYFGLYNRYLGILRVFYFNTDASGNGTEHSFEINMGTSNPTMKYPFYNALAYSIPTVHSSVNNAVDLCGTGILQTFKC